MRVRWREVCRELAREAVLARRRWMALEDYLDRRRS